MNIYIMLILVYINNGLQTGINVFLEPLGLVHFRGIVSYTTIKDIGQPNNHLFLWEFSDKVDQPISVIIIHYTSMYRTSRLFNPAWSAEHDY